MASDLWSTGPDKTTVVRIKRAIFEHVKTRFPQCVVIVDNLEAYIKRVEWEIIAPVGPAPTWFQAYVSIAAESVA